MSVDALPVVLGLFRAPPGGGGSAGGTTTGLLDVTAATSASTSESMASSSSWATGTSRSTVETRRYVCERGPTRICACAGSGSRDHVITHRRGLCTDKDHMQTTQGTDRQDVHQGRTTYSGLHETTRPSREMTKK